MYGVSMKSSLVTIDMTSGKMTELGGEPFVGIGEAIDVDPTDGTIIVMGHDSSRGGHHAVRAQFSARFMAQIWRTASAQFG